MGGFNTKFMSTTRSALVAAAHPSNNSSELRGNFGKSFGAKKCAKKRNKRKKK